MTEVNVLNCDAMRKGKKRSEKDLLIMHALCAKTATALSVFIETYRSHMCGNESQFVAPLLRYLFANRRGSIIEMLAKIGKAKRGDTLRKLAFTHDVCCCRSTFDYFV